MTKPSWWPRETGDYMASFETVSSTVLEKVAEGHTEKLVEVIVCALTRGTFAENNHFVCILELFSFSFHLY